jgi:hypothetical protein
MGYNVPAMDHFEGQANITKGARKGNDEILVEHLRKFRSGSVTAAGAGTESVVIDPAFEDTNYVIMLATDTVAAAPIWANKATGGFDIVVAAAGVVDWVAIHD